MQSPDFPKQVYKTAGEPYVWFTGMGLTIGLLMVISLLSLIVMHGFQAFWPQRVAQIVLKNTSSADVKGSKVIAGKITKKRQKILRTLSPEPDGEAPTRGRPSGSYSVATRMPTGFRYAITTMPIMSR
jgi:ABC-type phosphate transport system auxiliary subunit